MHRQWTVAARFTRRKYNKTATADNYEQRQQRLAFYKRNGFDRPMVGMSYLGMDFELMCSNPPLRLNDFKSLVAKIQNDY